VLVEQMLAELKMADERRGQLSAVMAQEVAAAHQLIARRDAMWQDLRSVLRGVCVCTAVNSDDDDE
jgi:hypothetical protein